jgi:hypothetical protein
MTDSDRDDRRPTVRAAAAVTCLTCRQTIPFDEYPAHRGTCAGELAGQLSLDNVTIDTPFGPRRVRQDLPAEPPMDDVERLLDQGIPPCPACRGSGEGYDVATCESCGGSGVAGGES